MKKIILLVFTGLLLASCSSDSESGNNPDVDLSKLIRTWHLQSATLGGSDISGSSADMIKFTSGNRTTHTFTGQGEGGETIYRLGDYVASGNSITIDWDDSETNSQYTILDLSSARLELRSTQNGQTLLQTYTN